MKIQNIDKSLISLINKSWLPVARFSIFVVYFWFGIIKIFDLSPASPLARSLVDKTVGDSHFHFLFITLAVLECLIGVLFLFPKLTRVVVPLLLVHLVIVSAPLYLLTNLTWQSFLVPTLEGQYIIKNILIIAVALGIASSVVPLSSKGKKSKR